MLPTEGFVELSRWQFALTSMYHFIFVPLTLVLSWILFLMESVYVMTGKEIYKDMTRFWGKLFGINFALGVTTGITMEFQFGTSRAYRVMRRKITEKKITEETHKVDSIVSSGNITKTYLIDLGAAF
jgi:uncharacterized membrane protein